jgi:hypothetical protein
MEGCHRTPRDRPPAPAGGRRQRRACVVILLAVLAAGVWVPARPWVTRRTLELELQLADAGPEWALGWQRASDGQRGEERVYLPEFAQPGYEPLEIRVLGHPDGASTPVEVWLYHVYPLSDESSPDGAQRYAELDLKGLLREVPADTRSGLWTPFEGGDGVVFYGQQGHLRCAAPPGGVRLHLAKTAAGGRVCLRYADTERMLDLRAAATEYVQVELRRSLDVGGERVAIRRSLPTEALSALELQWHDSAHAKVTVHSAAMTDTVFGIRVLRCRPAFRIGPGTQAVESAVHDPAFTTTAAAGSVAMHGYADRLHIVTVIGYGTTLLVLSAVAWLCSRIRQLRSARFLTTVTALIVLSSVALLCNRLFYGVDFLDESYYVAIPYSYALGAQPFVDEIAVHQSAALVTYPLVKLYYVLTGGAAGIILFMRGAYLVFCLGVSVLAYLTLRDFIDRRAAALIALLTVAFAPGNLFAASYNTLAALFFVSGALLSTWVISRSDPRGPGRWLFAAGLLYGSAVVAYPTFAVPVALTLAILVLWRSPIPRAKRLLTGCGCLIPLFILAGVVVYAGLDRFWADLAYQHPAQGGGARKLTEVLATLWRLCPHKGVFLPLGVALGLLAWKGGDRWRYAAIGPVALVCAPFTSTGRYHYSSMLYLAYFALCAPYIVLCSGRLRPYSKRLFWGVWVPSAVGGLTTAYSSANGAMNAAIGLWPGAVVTIVLCTAAFSRSGADEKPRDRAWSQVLAIAAPAGVLFVILGFVGHSVYSERATYELTERVTAGPFAGLCTSPEKKAFLNDLGAAMTELSRQRGRVLFYHWFPAGYLFSNKRPASNAVWSVAPAAAPGTVAAIMRYYQDPTNRPDVAVRIADIWGIDGAVKPQRYEENDPLNHYIEENFRAVSCMQWFTIFFALEPNDGAARAARRLDSENRARGATAAAAGHLVGGVIRVPGR